MSTPTSKFRQDDVIVCQVAELPWVKFGEKAVVDRVADKKYDLTCKGRPRTEWKDFIDERFTLERQ